MPIRGRRAVSEGSKHGVREPSGEGVGHAGDSLAGEPESFIDHLLATPHAGEDAGFDRLRSGSRRIET